MKTLLTLLFLLTFNPIARAETVCFSAGNNCDQVVINAIQHAKKSIDVAIFSFTKKNIADALVVAASSGVVVRVMMDDGQSISHYSQITLLKQANIPVKVQNHQGLMHDKFVVIDKKKVITGSYNWTSNATYSNDENLVSLDRLGSLYEAQFETMFAKGK